MPHYYSFLERTRKLNVNDGESICLDKSMVSNDSSFYHIEKSVE